MVLVFVRFAGPGCAEGTSAMVPVGRSASTGSLSSAPDDMGTL